MTNNKIVEAISGDVQAIIANMAVKAEHRDDLFQDMVMILLEYDNDKLAEMYNKNQLKFFIARILCNQYYSMHSAFYKTYKKYEDNKYNIKEGYKKLDGETD